MRLFFIVSLGALAVDQLGKLLVISHLKPGESLPVLPGIFNLTYVENPGGAFGILAYQTQIFVVLSILALFLIIVALFYFSKREQKAIRGLALLAGGVCGNLVDRLRRGYVVDFFDLRVWPVFNLADVFIFFGAVFLFVGLVRSRGTKKGR